MENNKFDWRLPLRFGFLGGVTMFYFSIIGMVEVFSTRDLIGTFLNMGHLLLYGGAFATGILVVRELNKASTGQKLVSSALAGLVAAVLPAILVLFSNAVDARDIFENASPGLVEFVTFERGVPGGLIMFFIVTMLVSVITSLYWGLGEKIKQPLTMSLTYLLVITIFSELVVQVLTNLFGRNASKFLFAGKSMHLVPAVVLFGVVFAIYYFRGQRVAAGVVKEKAAPTQRSKMIQLLLIIAGLAIAPWILGLFLSQALFEVGRFILMGLGLNIVVGYAGLLDLGYVAFFAFGAYTMGVLTTATQLNMGGGVFNFWLALPVAVLISVLFGVVMGFPVLRMRGDYLAIVTLGFGEIIRLLALSDWLAPIIGGAQGVLKIPNPVFFGIDMDSPQTMYYLVVIGSLLAGFISIRLRDSRLGRQWKAMREDEDVAEAMGINLVQTKLLAFAIGAGFSGLAGGIFAARLGTIFPHSFNLLISINALALIIVGGLGSIPGVVVGAIVLVGLPELLREFQEYRLLMYGLLLIVMMLIRPEGFIPTEVFKRELHADEEIAPIEAETKAEAGA